MIRLLALALVAAATVVWAVSHGRREIPMRPDWREDDDGVQPADEADGMCPHCITPWRCNGHDEGVDVCSCGEVLVQPADPHPVSMWNIEGELRAIDDPAVLRALTGSV